MPTPRAITGTLRRQGDDAPLVGAIVTFEAYRLIVDEHATHPPTSVSVTSGALGALAFSLTPGWWRASLPGARPVVFYVPDEPGATTLEALLAAAIVAAEPPALSAVGALLAAQTLGQHADVTVALAEDGDALVFDALTGMWHPGTVAGGGGGFSVVDNGDGTLTLEGAGIVDNGDGTLTIG